MLDESDNNSRKNKAKKKKDAKEELKSVARWLEVQ